MIFSVNTNLLVISWHPLMMLWVYIWVKPSAATAIMSIGKEDNPENILPKCGNKNGLNSRDHQ